MSRSGRVFVVSVIPLCAFPRIHMGLAIPKHCECTVTERNQTGSFTEACSGCHARSRIVCNRCKGTQQGVFVCGCGKVGCASCGERCDYCGMYRHFACKSESTPDDEPCESCRRDIVSFCPSKGCHRRIRCGNCGKFNCALCSGKAMGPCTECLRDQCASCGSGCAECSPELCMDRRHIKTCLPKHAASH